MNLKIEVEREEDERWIAEVMALPGCIAYGKSRADVLARAKALALRVLAFKELDQPLTSRPLPPSREP